MSQTLKKRKSLEHRRRLSESMKGRVPWNKGKHLSESHRRKLSEANIGKKLSLETRQKLSLARKGRVISIETRLKLSKALKDRKFSPEWRQRIGAASKGRVLSPESKRKLSESCKRYHATHVVSQETRRKIAASKIGKQRSPFSLEWRQKMSEAHKKWWFYPENRTRMSEARKGNQDCREEPPPINHEQKNLDSEPPLRVVYLGR